MSQEAVARNADLSTSAYAKIERAVTSPAWSTVTQIAAALDLTIGQLAAEVDREAAGKRRGTKRR